MVRAGDGMASQQVEAGMIHDSQRIAPGAIASLELPLVVSAPQLVWLRSRMQGTGICLDPSRAPPGLDSAGALEDVVDRCRAGDILLLQAFCQHDFDLLRARCALLAAQLQDQLLNGIGRA